MVAPRGFALTLERQISSAKSSQIQVECVSFANVWLLTGVAHPSPGAGERCPNPITRGRGHYTGKLTLSKSKPAAAALPGGENLQAGGPPPDVDRVDEFVANAFPSHLGSETFVVIVDWNELHIDNTPHPTLSLKGRGIMVGSHASIIWIHFLSPLRERRLHPNVAVRLRDAIFSLSEGRGNESR